MAREIPLSGGRTTAGIVRVGDTVRRPSTSNSPFVTRLLRHLEARGFDGAPRALGTDAQGRDMLTYIAGEVPGELGWHDDAVLAAAARLIRRYHDASAGLPGTANDEVVCHHDLSPCNAVFRGGLPVALIDFDAAAPGARAVDLGYAAWLWLDLGDAAIGAERQRQRLDRFLDAYGPGPGRDAVIIAMLGHQQRLADEGRRHGDSALTAWAETCRAWTLGHRDTLTG